jgi:hypothetical protein
MAGADAGRARPGRGVRAGRDARGRRAGQHRPHRHPAARELGSFPMIATVLLAKTGEERS